MMVRCSVSCISKIDGIIKPDFWNRASLFVGIGDMGGHNIFRVNWIVIDRSRYISNFLIFDSAVRDDMAEPVELETD